MYRIDFVIKLFLARGRKLVSALVDNFFPRVRTEVIYLVTDAVTGSFSFSNVLEVKPKIRFQF